MRISGFSNVSTQPFLAAPMQLLMPWVARLKNALGCPAELRVFGQGSHRAKQTFVLDQPAATGHPVVNPIVRSLKAVPRSGVRVIREFDPAVSPDCAGRMVISGRMADVCAELDRMALRSTAVH